MKQEWIKILTQITDNLDNVDQIKCPVCGEHGIDYIYIGDEGTRVGFLQIWCNKCLKGIYISRAVAPNKAKFASFESELRNVVPKYEFVEE